MPHSYNGTSLFRVEYQSQSAIDHVAREERNVNTHALLLSPCLDVYSVGAAESRHSNLFEAYFGISAEEAESWSRHEFDDIDLHKLFQKHSLLATNGVARDFLQPFFSLQICNERACC
jgi:hypothetical protein